MLGSLYKKGLFVALYVCFPTLLKADPLSLSQAPLSVSRSVAPNVMLLLDNSGSMNHIVWDSVYAEDNNGALVWSSGYNDSVVYNDWSDGNWQSGSTVFSSGIGNCTNGGKYGENSAGAWRCLILPAPEGGNTRYLGNYLNYLFENFGVNSSTVDLTSGSNALSADAQRTRMETVRRVARKIIDETPNIRFGLTKLGKWDGNSLDDNTVAGTVVAGCADPNSLPNPSNPGYTHKNLLEGEISALTASTWTPLAEAYYEVTRYFRGIGASASNGFPGGSPIKYRCQKNFTIILTDGLPTYDATFPSSDPDVPSGRTVQNWDGNASNDGTGGNQSNEGSNLHLDDVALFAWDTDFKKSGDDAAGVSFNDAAFSKQNMLTYTVGFAVNNQMLIDAADTGRFDNNPDDGQFYLASNEDTLLAALKAALQDIAEKSGSSSSAAASTGRVQAGSRVYQARFNSADWSGALLAFDIESDPTNPNYGNLKENLSGNVVPAFDAAFKIPGWNARTIISNKANVASGGNSGIPFRWGQFTGGTNSERDRYFNNDQAMLQYLRGRNTSDSNRDVSIYRARPQSSGKYNNLGDIVHSSPYYVGAPSARYTDTFESKKYSEFAATYKNRTPMVYVGANDGMLHGMDAASGVEKFAFIPGSLLPKLRELSDPNYVHKYYVDGSPTVVDAFDATNQKWRTVLVGGLNQGGQAIYALDITDPSTFSESNASSLFLWEFTDADDADLGYTYSRPKIIKMRDGKWYAVFGNGYNNTEADGNVSTTGDAAIYIVDLWTGTLFKKITVGTGTSKDPTASNRPNGFATITPVDITGDNVVDYIYGGDLFGNVWKFDVSDADTSKWELDYRLFTACSGVSCNASNTQPITTSVTVGRSKNGIGHMVYFGTGKYLETTDNNGAAGGVQSFYGIWDKGATVVGRSALLEQSIISEVPIQVTNKNGTPDDTSDDFQEIVPLRKTSNNYASTSNLGWYIDLVPPGNNSERGERLVSAPVLRGDRIIFVTSIPADDPCSPSGDSWIMTMDALNGGRLNHTYDIDKDRSFGQGDKRFTEGGDPVVATGIKVASGGNSPSFMPGTDVDKVIISGTDKIDIVDLYEGDNVNRQSWQQISR